MANRKLTEIEKAYIEKFCDEKSPEKLAKEIGVGVGAKTISKYVDAYKDSMKNQPSIPDTGMAQIKQDNLTQFDPTELAGRHDRGGVLTMTQGLSEFLDEQSKKTQVHDYRGKMAKIRKDKPGPKNVKLDE
jgi:hypothetical protein